MEITLRNTRILLGYSIVMCTVLISCAHPMQIAADYVVDEPGVIQMHSLQFDKNSVDLPQIQVENVMLPDWIRKSRPHKRHHQTSDQHADVLSCCPSKKEIVEPEGGKSISGELVELYQTENVKQRFYEISCDPSIVNQRCRFVDRKHLEYSKCEQQYSYSYALVRDFATSESEESNSVSAWRMDYIQVRSGCACKIRVPH